MCLLPSTCASGQRSESPLCREEAGRGEGSWANPDFPSLMGKELPPAPGREDLGFEGATGGSSGRKFGFSSGGGGANQFLNLSALFGQGFATELMHDLVRAGLSTHPLSRPSLMMAV